MAMEEMNVPVYPEERVYKEVFADMWCENTSSAPEPVLMVYGRHETFSGQYSRTVYNCKNV